ncbi:MAG: PHP domain-containing protein [Bacteroidales bacterium]
MKADLHIHSRISGDGEHSPETLMQMAWNEGLELITLTDHNSTRGCGAAAEAAASRDLLFLPGVEIDCAFEGTDMHLLGLGIRAGDPWFESLENEIRENRMALVPAMWENLKKLGIRVNLEDVMAQARGKPLMVNTLRKSCSAGRKQPRTLCFGPISPVEAAATCR